MTPHKRGVFHADKRQRDYRYRVSVRPLVNRTDTIKKILNSRKIQMQVTAVARPRNHQSFFAHFPGPLSQTFKICGIILPHYWGCPNDSER